MGEMNEKAIEILKSLVNRVEALTFQEANTTTAYTLLQEIREAIGHVVGTSSEEYKTLNVISLYRGGANKSNRESYFHQDKTRLSGLLNRIIIRLELEPLSNINTTPEMATSDTIPIMPSFGKPISSAQWSQVFVLMPFSDNLKAVYTQHIRKVAIQLNLTCKRGDNFFTAGSIINDIWSAIYHAQVCIADCTGRNPNVFYEMGIAHTVGRPTILIAQSKEDIPFDIQHIRHIIYENTQQGLLRFDSQLSQTLRHIIPNL